MGQAEEEAHLEVGHMSPRLSSQDSFPAVNRFYYHRQYLRLLVPHFRIHTTTGVTDCSLNLDGSSVTVQPSPKLRSLMAVQTAGLVTRCGAGLEASSHTLSVGGRDRYDKERF